MRSLADHFDLYTFVNLRKPNLASPVRWVRCYGKRFFPLSRRRCLRFPEQQLTPNAALNRCGLTGHTVR